MALGLDVAKIIKYEGPNDVLVWKHPIEDFNTTSQLIVHESQEAILFKDGQALDLFRAGRHTLTTENIPLLRRIMSIPTNGKTPFHCEVYFINKVDVLDVFWGTDQPLPILDPIYGIILPVRANGQFALNVINSRQLLTKLVGTTKDMTKKRISELFKGMLMSKVKNLISEMMTSRQISFLQIHNYINEISDIMRAQVSPLYEEYGMSVVNFFVNSISVPSDDPGYMKIKNALAAAKEKELLARGTRAEMDVLGYSYQEKRTFDVLDKAAQNEGAGAGVLGASLGMGVGINVGNMVGNSMAHAMSNNINTGFANGNDAALKGNQFIAQTSKEVIVCSKCHATLPAEAKFCMQCGEKVVPSFCPDCGAAVVAGARFCLQCGKQL